MRNAWGIVFVMALVGTGCASQSGSTQQTSTTPAESGGEQQPSTDATAVSPERQDAIERAFERKVGELHECWSTEYEKTHDRKLEGDVTVAFDIGPNGSPSNVRILKSSLNNQDIESCMTKTIADWAFPEGPATVPYMRTVHLGAQF